jgi:pimeloyl-ACP methyl ester carboxylesterase
MLVTTPDGRALCVHEGGDPDGFPIVMQHGSPSGGLLYEAHSTLARDHEIRLLGYDRPGYGGSTRRYGRTVADCVRDLEAIADTFELGSYATWGISGGGPHALACAALCDERLVATACLGSPAPYDARGLDWYADMGENNVDEFERAARGEEELRHLLESATPALLDADPAGLADAWAGLLGAQDAEALRGPLASYLVESERHGLGAGPDGWVDDDLAFVEGWGFELASIERPVLVLHGEDDRFVPVAHARWVADAVPGAETRIGADDGHLTLFEHRVGEVHEWLRSRR